MRSGATTDVGPALAGGAVAAVSDGAGEAVGWMVTTLTEWFVPPLTTIRLLPSFEPMTASGSDVIPTGWSCAGAPALHWFAWLAAGLGQTSRTSSVVYEYLPSTFRVIQWTFWLIGMDVAEATWSGVEAEANLRRGSRRGAAAYGELGGGQHPDGDGHDERRGKRGTDARPAGGASVMEPGFVLDRGRRARPEVTRRTVRRPEGVRAPRSAS
jgi:hypothetical protein